MDTAWCDAALELADGADLVVCEATFLSTEQHLAAKYGHITAREAGRLAAQAGARRLVLTHFSRRYPDVQAFADEAGEEFDDVVLATDLAPHRRPGSPLSRPSQPSRGPAAPARRPAGPRR